MYHLHPILAFLGIDIGGHVQHWMHKYSYGALFGLLFACGLGFPLPEDIPLLFAGAFIATGKMHLALAATCAWCGIVGGDIVLYHLGKIFGMEIKRIPVIGRHVSERRIEQVHRMFEKWGVWVVAVGRMFAGIRGTMVVVAGAIRFTFWKFLLADGLAAIVSGGLFLALGFVFGHHMHWLMERVDKGKMWAFLVLAIAAAGSGIWFYLRHRKRRRHRGSHDSDSKSVHPHGRAEPVPD